MNRIGWRATIVSTLHSHARVRANGAALVGREGVVVAVLRNGTAALVQLDEQPFDLPGGAQRWPLQWDDLDLKEPVELAAAPLDYVAGLSFGRVHAVIIPGTKAALCSAPVGPLPVCGWSVSFSPNASRACPECVAVLTDR
ncbi:hypothetical protein ACBI99_15105 [Nonomuraea sp. ATR24]|uniref:hypothetical protein n=1 Tax=Nonomuraea sp. ATR24 TaxID=1676744 RepID=UPI0035C0BCD3